MACCKRQADRGGTYLHEHPQSPMCRFGMKVVGPDGSEGDVRKETLFMTNSKFVAEELEGVCSNNLEGKVIHRHVHLIGGGRAKAAQVYPVALVQTVLSGLKREMEERKWINSFEEEFTGPSPDDYVAWEEQVAESQEVYLDEISGAVLDVEGVRKARLAELDWLRKAGVYKRVPKRLCEEANQKPLALKWVDVNKGDATHQS